jgi:GntR family transcriptional regulator
MGTDMKAPKGMPLYQRIRAQLLKNISSNNLNVGDPIPTEAELMKRFGASRTTVRNAISCLVNEDLIIREPGRGSFVKKSLFKRHVKLTGSYSDILGVGKRTLAKVLRFEYVKPTFDVMQELKIGEDERVLRIDRVRFVDGIPFLYSINYVPEDIGRSFSIRDLEEHNMTELLTKKSRQDIKEFVQNFSAAIAEDQIAELLKVPRAFPLLEIKRVAISRDQRPINLLFGYFRSDIYVFSSVFSFESNYKHDPLKLKTHS